LPRDHGDRNAGEYGDGDDAPVGQRGQKDTPDVIMQLYASAWQQLPKRFGAKCRSV
jgi:hypothetical protein